MPKEPASSVVPETEWDKTEMAYHEVPATDEDGNPIETSAGKPAGGEKRASGASDKEN